MKELSLRTTDAGLLRRALISLALGLSLAAAVAAQDGIPTSAKVGVIDVDRVMEESKAGQAVIEQLKAFREEKGAALKAKKDAVDELTRRYNESRLTLAEDKLAEMEKQLEDMAIDFQRAQDDANRELQKYNAESLGKIETQVLPIINQVGAEMGFTLIFNKYQSGLLYADDAIDITDAVIQRFDQGS